MIDEQSKEVELHMGPSGSDEVRSDTYVMSHDPDFEEQFNAQLNAQHEEQEEDVFSVRIGDVFVNENGQIVVTVLAYSPTTGSMKVRPYATVLEEMETTLDKFIEFVDSNGLVKLNTFMDQMVEVSKKLLLNEGDVFTRNGEFFLEILSAEMLYVDPRGKQNVVIGCRDSNDLVAFRDALEVKASIFGNTDQFPPQ